MSTLNRLTGRRSVVGLTRMVSALVRQRRRLALASVAIALSVGYLAGALSLLDRVSAGLDNLAAAGTENADLIIEGEVAYESALEQTRRLVPTMLTETVAAVPGVASVSPRFEEITMVLRSDGEPVVAPGLSEQPIGSNWPDDDEMSPYRFVGEGRPPGPGEVVIDERTAREAGVGVGDEVPIVGRSQPAVFTVVGIVATDQGELPEGSSLALFDTATARELFAAGDNANRIAIRVDDGADVEQVAASIRALLPGGAELVDAETGAEHRQVSLTRSFTLIRVLILGFACLALAVGMGTVANSLTLLYSERRRTMASLRLVGARPRQLLAASLIEAAMLAAAASLIGVPLGIILGWVIERALGVLGTAVPVGGAIVSPSALLTAVLIGLVATVLAAVVPAWRAGRVPPIEAVAEVAPSGPEQPWRRALNTVIASVGAAAVAVGLMALADVPMAVALGVGVGIVLLAAIVVTVPAALAHVVAAGVQVAPWSSPTLRRIGSRDARRNRARTAATTAALLIATGVVASIAVLLSSFASSVDGDVGGLVRSDLVVDSGTFTRGGLPPQLLDQLRELDGVEAVTGWQVGRVFVDGTPVRLTGVDGASLDKVMDPSWLPGSADRLTPTGIALSGPVAEQLGLSVGDSVPVLFFSGGTENMKVEGIYSGGTMLLGEAMIDRSTLVRQIPASIDLAALVTLADDSPAVIGEVEDVAAEYGVTAVLPPEQFVDRRSDLLTGFERVIQWMLLFTLVQALVGVVNTLLMSVGERRREFGLLRIAGASPRQIRSMVLNEGLSFAVVGTGLGLLFGVGAAAVAVRALGGLGLTTLSIPVLVLFATAIASVSLGVLAAVVPARWASTVPPLEAVADSGTLPLRKGSGRLSSLFRPAPPEVVTVEVPAAPTYDLGPTYEPEPTVASEPTPVDPAVPLIDPVEPTVDPTPTPTPTPTPVDPATPPPFRGTVPAQPPPAPAEPALEPPVEPLPIAARAADPAAGWLRSDRSEAEPRRDRQRNLFEPAPTTTSGGVPPLGGSRRRRPATIDPAARLRLGDVIELLDPVEARSATRMLESFARVLEPDERVEHMVQGWTGGLACLLARTDRRLLVVIDRFPDVTVEAMSSGRTRVSMFGPPGSALVSLSVLDGKRLLEITGIAGRDQARALCTGVAPRSTGPAGRDQYF